MVKIATPPPPPPLKKVTPSFPTTPLKAEILSILPLFENLVRSSTPPAERGAAHYGYQYFKGTIITKSKIFNFGPEEMEAFTYIGIELKQNSILKLIKIHASIPFKKYLYWKKEWKTGKIL